MEIKSTFVKAFFCSGDGHVSENVVYVLSTHEIDDFSLLQTENVALGYPSKTKTIPFDSTRSQKALHTVYSC